MEFGQAVSSGFSNYANFSGRSQRSALWWWILFSWIVGVVAAVIDYTLFGVDTHVLYYLAGLGLLVPSIAVAVRRLHDTARSGWFILLGLIPLVGGIILIVWYCQPGTPGPNQYGLDPIQGDLLTPRN
jgi:uncharacterized membrane protein YhaH (DUF805 family)